MPPSYFVSTLTRLAHCIQLFARDLPDSTYRTRACFDFLLLLYHVAVNWPFDCFNVFATEQIPPTGSNVRRVNAQHMAILPSVPRNPISGYRYQLAIFARISSRSGSFEMENLLALAICRIASAVAVHVDPIWKETSSHIQMRKCNIIE